MTKLVLIRHGETDENKNHNLCGWSNPCLNNSGRRAAMGLSNYLKDFDLDIIVSSGLKRTDETAELIKSNRDTILISNEEFKELNFGEFEGAKMQYIERNYPDLFKALEADFINFRFPMGESLHDMNTRVIAATTKLLKEYKGKNIALVVHSGVIRCIIAYFIAGDIKRHWSFKVDHCSVSILEFHEDFSVLTGLNDTTFLNTIS